MNLTYDSNDEEKNEKIVNNSGDNDDDMDVSAANDRHGHELTPSRAQLHTSLLTFALFNHLLEKLGPIMDFSYSVLVPHIVHVLNSYCDSHKRTKQEQQQE